MGGAHDDRRGPPSRPQPTCSFPGPLEGRVKSLWRLGEDPREGVREASEQEQVAQLASSHMWEVLIPRHLPQNAIRISEVAGVSAPVGLLGRFHDAPATGRNLGEDLIDLWW